MFEYKACSLPYFLDQMQGYELSIILEQLQYNFKESWEQTRFISYILALSQSTKHLKPTDILSFSWDKDVHKTDISNDDIKRLTNKMNEVLKNKNK